VKDPVGSAMVRAQRDCFASRSVRSLCGVTVVEGMVHAEAVAVVSESEVDMELGMVEDEMNRTAVDLDCSGSAVAVAEMEHDHNLVFPTASSVQRPEAEPETRHIVVEGRKVRLQRDRP